jgi:hypothetical protein
MNEPGSAPLMAGQWWAIALCALAAFFDGYDAQMLAMAIPLLADAFHVQPTALAAAASGSLAGMAIERCCSARWRTVSAAALCSS